MCNLSRRHSEAQWRADRVSNSMVLLVSLAASFSPLSSNIYFPALDLIADAMNTSNATFALSVSIYMYVSFCLSSCPFRPFLRTTVS